LAFSSPEPRRRRVGWAKTTAGRESRGNKMEKLITEKRVKRKQQKKEKKKLLLEQEGEVRSEGNGKVQFTDGMRAQLRRK
jgi:hypothetical protein